MLHSSELRWFFAGETPAVMVAWFTRARTHAEPVRIDSYLRFPGCDCVGVKLRGSQVADAARIEIKARVGMPEPIAFAHGVCGSSDRWVKWTCDEPQLAVLVPKLVSHREAWIAVEKERRLRKLASVGGALEEVDPLSHVEAGATLELSSLRVRGVATWSLALEAFGEPEQIAGQLRRMGDWLFRDAAPPLPLRESDSRAYPAWLAAL